MYGKVGEEVEERIKIGTGERTQARRAWSKWEKKYRRMRYRRKRGEERRTPVERKRETIRSERARESERESRRRHRFRPLPIRWQPVMELQIQRHYMPLGNLWFRAQFYASTRPVTSPLHLPFTFYPSLSLSLSLSLFQSSSFSLSVAETALL